MLFLDPFRTKKGKNALQEEISDAHVRMNSCKIYKYIDLYKPSIISQLLSSNMLVQLDIFQAPITLHGTI